MNRGTRDPVVVAAAPFEGHVRPVILVAEALAQRGHPVTFVGAERFRSRVRSFAEEFVPLGGLAAIGPEALNEQFPERAALPPGPQQLAFDLTRIFTDVVPDQHAALQAALADRPGAALLSDLFFTGAWPAALGCGARPSRHVAINISTLDLPTDEVPDPAVREMVAALFGAATDHLREVIAGMGCAGPDRTWDHCLYDLPDTIAQTTIAEFELPRDTLPDRIRYVGPILPLAPPRSAAPSPYLAPGKRTVLVTQGTVANDDLEELVLPTVRVLAERSDVRVLAAAGKAVAPEDVPDTENAVVEEYIPFDEVLPHVDLFVTNGGLGSVQLALANGVPVLSSGVSEDKPRVSARLVAAGAGLSLDAQRPDPDELRGALDRILGDPSFAEAARRLRTAYDAAPGVDGVVALLEGEASR